MSTDNTEKERKALLEIVEQMENPAATIKKQKFLQRVVFGIGYLGLLAGFILAWHRVVNPVASSLVVAFAGAAIGLGVFLKWSGSMWPVTVKYIDLERVRQRLDELNAGSTHGPDV